jgi:hypothetical protein
MEIPKGPLYIQDIAVMSLKRMCICLNKLTKDVPAYRSIGFLIRASTGWNERG